MFSMELDIITISNLGHYIPPIIQISFLPRKNINYSVISNYRVYMHYCFEELWLVFKFKFLIRISNYVHRILYKIFKQCKLVLMPFFLMGYVGISGRSEKPN